MSEQGFDEWVIVELMGHRRLAGRLTEVEIAGKGFLRLDIPTEPRATQYYSPAAVYAITPATEETARRAATLGRIEPVHRWELPAETPRHADSDDVEDAEIEDRDEERDVYGGF